MIEVNEKTPKVSVCVITFNHERYIRQCLQSIVDQQTDFEFEVIVGDDASTDGTRAIVQEFAKRHPQTVIPILHEKNIGGTQNYFAVHNRARGEYIAHIDGDDFALPGKLENQARILDREPRTALVVHECRVVDADNNVVRSSFHQSHPPPLADIDYLMENLCFFTHSSKMYRRSHVKTRQSQREIVDYYFHVEHLGGDLIRWLPDVLGGRREHSEGVSRKSPDLMFASYMHGYDAMKLLGIDERLIRRSRLRFKYSFAIGALQEGALSTFEEHIRLTKAEASYASAKHLALCCASRLGFARLIQRTL